jgi:hypothetical protein
MGDVRKAMIILMVLAACGPGKPAPTRPPSPSATLDAVPLGTTLATPNKGHVLVRGWRPAHRADTPPPDTEWSYANVRFCPGSGDTFAVRGGEMLAFFSLDMAKGPDIEPYAPADGKGEVDTSNSSLLVDKLCVEGNLVFVIPIGASPDHVLWTVGSTTLAWTV